MIGDSVLVCFQCRVFWGRVTQRLSLKTCLEIITMESVLCGLIVELVGHLLLIIHRKALLLIESEIIPFLRGTIHKVRVLVGY